MFIPRKLKIDLIVVKDKNVNRLIGKVIPRNEIFAILDNDSIFRLLTKMRTLLQFQSLHIVLMLLRKPISWKKSFGSMDSIILSFPNIARTDYLAAFPLKDLNKYKRTIGELLVSNGFFEIWTNSLTNQTYQQKHNLIFKGDAVEILNKLSEEQGILRQTLLFTGLEVCAYNINRRQKDLKLFEFGKIYYKESDSIKKKNG